MEILSTKSNVAASLQVAIGYSDTDFKSFIRDAQDFDLKPALPEKFYFDMLANLEETNYAQFIEGGEYDFEGVTYDFRGARVALDYFAYSRFVLNSSAQSTSHGWVVKTTPNSTPLSLEERKNIYYMKRTEANSILAEAIKYVERNIGDFPNFADNSCSKIKNNSNFTTRIIK